MSRTKAIMPNRIATKAREESEKGLREILGNQSRQMNNTIRSIFQTHCQFDEPSPKLVLGCRSPSQSPSRSSGSFIPNRNPASRPPSRMEQLWPPPSTTSGKPGPSKSVEALNRQVKAVNSKVSKIPSHNVAARPRPGITNKIKRQNSVSESDSPPSIKAEETAAVATTSSRKLATDLINLSISKTLCQQLSIDQDSETVPSQPKSTELDSVQQPQPDVKEEVEEEGKKNSLETIAKTDSLPAVVGG
ncbi:hypothetical protein DAPPUDRAFT_226600, partial [Daphnia pulex]